MPYKDKDKQREYQKLWARKQPIERNSPSLGTKRFFYTAASKLKSKCNILNIPYDLDGDYLENIYPEDGKCPALLLPFERGRGHSQSQSPTIDRIVPANGYVKGNVQWVSRLANVIMSDATPDQVLQVGEYFYKLKG
tara:strand:+ start:1068 stop:1478 length:411 start_codon:yes stop_codon:yes gene_type:complete